MFAEIAQDLRFSLRQLRRYPSLSAAILLVLAIGIGTTTAVFTVVHAVLLEAPPYAEPERTVTVWNRYTNPQDNRVPLSPPGTDDLAGESGIFTATGAFARQSYELTGGDEPERVFGAGVSEGFFSVLRVRPVLGRLFLPEEQTAGRDQVMILSANLWRTRFGRDAAILRRSVYLNGKAYRVIGVLPGEFNFPDWASLWTPLALDRSARTYNRGNEYLRAIARLRQRVNLPQAQARLDTLALRISNANRATYPAESGFGLVVVPLQDLLVEKSRPTLLLLSTAVMAVLFIACANAATLLLARALAREAEVVTRASLGASRSRLIRQVATEGLVPTLVAGALGLLVAHFLTRLLILVMPEKPAGIERAVVSGGVLAFTLGLSFLTGIVASLAPALHSSRVAVERSIIGTWYSRPVEIRSRRALSLLTITQIAVTFVLLITTSLLTASFTRLASAPPGFDPRGVLTLRVNPAKWRYQNDASVLALYRALLGELSSLPRVTAVGITSIVPLTAGSWSQPFTLKGALKEASALQAYAEVRVVSPDFLKAMKIPIFSGRAFNERDSENAEKVVVVDRALARNSWPGEDPIGKKLGLGTQPGESEWRTVIGVCGDVRSHQLAEPPPAHIYLPFPQFPLRNLNFVLRAADGIAPRALIAPVKAIVRRLDPRQPLENLTTLDELVAASVAPARFALSLIAALALIAWLLVSYGLFGVMAYSVRHMRPELGTRLALGATPSDVLFMLLRRLLALVLLGLGFGLLVSPLVVGVVRSLLFETGIRDPLSYLAPAAVLLATGLSATILAARRTVYVPPISLLRADRNLSE